MNNTTRSYFFAAATVLFWSTVATAFKLTLRYSTVQELLMISSITSALVLYLLIRLQGKGADLWKGRAMLPSVYIGLLNPFLYYVVLFQAYDMLPAQQAQTLNYLWPIVLVLFSVMFLKQKLSLRMILALILSFVGVVCIATEGDVLALNFHDPLGVLLALSSTVIWAAYWILNLKEKADRLRRLFYNFLFGALYVIIFRTVVEGPAAIVAVGEWQGIVGGVYVGLFEMGITFYTWMKALEYSDTTARVSNLIYLAPFLSLLLISIVLGESILPATIFGLLLIVAGILLQQFNKKSNVHSNENTYGTN